MCMHMCMCMCICNRGCRRPYVHVHVRYGVWYLAFACHCAWWCCEGGEGDCVRELLSSAKCVTGFCCEFYIPSTPVNSLVPPAAQPKAASNHIVPCRPFLSELHYRLRQKPKRGRCRRLGNELIKAPRSTNLAPQLVQPTCPAGPRCPPAHRARAERLYSQPLPHTRCQARRDSHHPSLRARQKQ